MKPETELAIDEILEHVAYCAIPIDWRTANPYPGVGQRKGTRRGPGLDFLGTSIFKEGDDERHINWIATAQAADDDEIFKTVYRQRKELKAHVFVDAGRTMRFGTTRTTKLGLAAEVAASIHYALDKTRDKVGTTVYTEDGVVDTIPVQSARLNLMPSLLAILESGAGEAGQSKHGGGLTTALSGIPASRRLLFVVSDFLTMSDNDWEELSGLSVHHDVIAVVVADLREKELPEPEAGSWFQEKLGYFIAIEDHDGASRILFNNAAARKKWSDNWKAHEEQVLRKLDECGIETLSLSTEEGDAGINKILELFSGHST